MFLCVLGSDMLKSICQSAKIVVMSYWWWCAEKRTEHCHGKDLYVKEKLKVFTKKANYWICFRLILQKEAPRFFLT